VITLHPFQCTVVDQIEKQIEQGQRKLLLVAPTGSGKTVMGAAIINRVVAHGHRVLVIAHRREIITQTRDKLVANGLNPGVVLAGLEDELRPFAEVQVAAIQTLHARAVRSKRMAMPAATYLIIDEAHHARAKTYQKLLDIYPDARVIGLTATPCRGDGKGLGNIFEKLIEAPQVAELIVGGYLVRSRVYAPIDPDLRGVKTQSGDYVVKQLAARMNTAGLVGDVVSDWREHSERRRTVVFACSVGHSVAIRNAFLAVGVAAEHLDGETPKDERDAILARLKSGETQVVSNCMVLTEGWDMPEVGCCILARPTKQMGLFRQMIGRVLRPCEGKPDAIILDHSGAVFRHGLPEDHIEWTLDVDCLAENPKQKSRARGEEPKLRECPDCKVLMAAPPCPQCGWIPAPRRRGEDIDFEEGELGLVVNGKAQAPPVSEAERMSFFQQLRAVQQQRGYKAGWAAYKFKDKFGKFPPWKYRDLAPIPPSDETLRWIKSRNIAFFRAREAAA
jgi:superfamily II DNA or RNA helicase